MWNIISLDPLSSGANCSVTSLITLPKQIKVYTLYAEMTKTVSVEIYSSVVIKLFFSRKMYFSLLSLSSVLTWK